MRRALLIGAQTHGLTGVENDVAAMAETLDRHGFVVHRCEGSDATRGGILEAYQRLIGEAEPDDAVFVYYSGHGGYIRPPTGPAESAEEPDPSRPAGAGVDLARRPPMQFIVPSDYDESSEDDFRGITAVELSVLQAELTARTKNVVVALDCCHAAYMSRDPDLRVKALYRPAIATYHTVSEHIARLRRQGLRVDLRHPVGNEHAVRIVACAPEQSAYEYTNSSGVRIGMLTEALTQALAEAADLPLTWFTLMQSVRRRVLNLAPNQRPEVEGPSRRLLFSVTESDPIVACPVVPATAGRVTLPGARLLGSQVGDEFTIMPPDTSGVDPEASVGVAVVDRIGALSAQATVRYRPPWKTLPANARAYRSRSAAPALPVRLPQGGGPRVDDLAAAITRSPLLRVATPDDATAVEVRLDRAGRFVVHDRVGALHEPRFAGPSGIAQVVTDLERLARAAALRQLPEDPQCLLAEPVTVEWGRVTDAGAEPLRSGGAVLHEGERVYVRVRNEGRQSVYVSLVDIGVSARIALLTNFSPSGVRLSPGEEYVLGFDDLDGRLVGVPLIWPTGVPRSGSRLETILAIVTSAPQDVGLLQQEGIRGHERSFGRSPLEDLFAQVALGTVRELGQAPGPSVRYAVRTIDFLLAPTPPPPAETVPFLVDDRPDSSVRLLATRGAAPSIVAVRLHELVVHRNRALGGADVRVDAVVLTGGDDAGQPVYRARTERFHNVRDGDRLPLDRMLIYHGPAVDYLDLAIWVSRDTTDSLALSDLLREQLGSQEVQEAGLQLAGLMVAAPQAATAVAAVGAGAVIINVAYRLLLGAVGKSIGLYRTSLLAQEGFGVGRHPAQGLLRAQDFSFAFTIDAVD